VSTPAVIDVEGVDRLVRLLRAQGYTVVGPQARAGGIVYDELEGVGSLPAGLEDVQEAGHYRLAPREDGALFAHTTGHDSAKRFLFPPRLALWRARRGAAGGHEYEAPPAPPRYAFVGLRSCDLHAVAIQDRVFIGDGHADADYEARRRDALFVAVNCSRAGGTCFCASMETGPRVTGGHDIALTELIDERGHRFLAEPGSERGAELIAQLPSRSPAPDELRTPAERAERVTATMGRSLETDGIRELLHGNLEHPRWAEVADRCLSCGNCTMVCPTCFCSTAEDVDDLTATEATHSRVWDSCFTLEHSYMHGGSVRSSTRSRYRQWATHKLASWIDQFGSSGCIGCGRCITWCPVGIDITEEVAAIRAADLREGLDATA
jgi:ferredoxin